MNASLRTIFLKSIIGLLILGFALSTANGQIYVVGESYFAENDFAEYIHGNLPIILSAPHGGDKRPTDIPDRSCSGCVYVNDSFTQELAREVMLGIVERTGCYPHVIINRLHRSKLDGNREIIEAADGNNLAEEAWEYYHGTIDTVQEMVTVQWGKGLFVDLHGHGHTIQRLELGYLLSKSDLDRTDSSLNNPDFAENSSIAYLYSDNLKNQSFAELIRGEYAFGSLIDEDGFDAVPSASDPSPETSDPYFTGGYNTREYGSRDNGTIDAIQIECNRDVRFDEDTRKIFADSLASVILNFLQEHYFEAPLGVTCNNIVQVNELEIEDFSISPNPASDFMRIKTTDKQLFDLSVYDTFGRLVKQNRDVSPSQRIDITDLQPGCYVVYIFDSKANYRLSKLIVN